MGSAGWGAIGPFPESSVPRPGLEAALMGRGGGEGGNPAFVPGFPDTCVPPSLSKGIGGWGAGGHAWGLHRGASRQPHARNRARRAPTPGRTHQQSRTPAAWRLQLRGGVGGWHPRERRRPGTGGSIRVGGNGRRARGAGPLPPPGAVREPSKGPAPLHRGALGVQGAACRQPPPARGRAGAGSGAAGREPQLPPSHGRPGGRWQNYRAPMGSPTETVKEAGCIGGRG